MAGLDPGSFDADELTESLLRLATWSGIGFIVGALSAFGAYELYPPARTLRWTILALAAVTVLVMAGLYGTAVWLGDSRAADWLVIGFTVALVLGTGLVVARELLTMINDHLLAAVWLERLDAIRARLV
jgi:4-amino-4-deoxy-L-arabinose transferase-like glycosyltransferase